MWSVPYGVFRPAKRERPELASKATHEFVIPPHADFWMQLTDRRKPCVANGDPVSCCTCRRCFQVRLESWDET